MPKKKLITKKTTFHKSTPKKSHRRFSRLLGMKDIAPAEHFYFSLITEKARQLAELYSFSPIKTPILESIDLYRKSTRGGSDKDFYPVDCEKGEAVVLRPEITQGIIRSYFENNLDQVEQPVRLFSLGPVFRREKLQSGRYRESTQLNLEIIGEKKPMAEALVISAANSFFKEFNLDVQVQINSLGGPECRKEYSSKLMSFYKERGRRSKLCNNCRKNLGKNMFALLDCQEEECVKMHSEAPQIADCLSEESQNHFKKVLEYLDELNINYNFNPYLVRGLSYYNDIVFEFWPVSETGEAQGKLALAGGGRYDEFISHIGNIETSAVGLAIGLERVMTKIKDKITKQPVGEDLIFIAQLGEQAKIKAMLLFEDLRQVGYSVRQSFSSDSLKNQIEEATRLKSKISLILGKKEVMDETIILRDMESGSQEIIAYKKIKDKLSKKFNRKEGVYYG